MTLVAAAQDIRLRTEDEDEDEDEDESLPVADPQSAE